LLLERGADPKMPEEAAPQGRPLFEACCRNHLQVAELLLEHGADPNAGVDSSGCCLTICKVYHNKAARPLEQLLRRYGAYTPPYAMTTEELTQALREGHQAIHHEEFLGNAIAKRNGELLDLYLESCPATKGGLQHWDGVTYPSSPAMVRKLLARGLDPNRPDWLGRTFLHTCAEKGDRSAAAVFLKAGADINARDVEFQGTPLAAAVRSEASGNQQQRAKHAERRRRMIEFLLNRGAATNLPGEQAWATPLAWARRRGLADIEALLIEHGAT
jgi:ankyrin repeat protein